MNRTLCILCFFVATLHGYAAKKSCCTATLDAGEVSGDSVYVLHDQWMDQDGNKTQLSDFKGDVVVVAMFFSSCQYACPRIVGDMKKIESLAPSNGVRYVLASFDTWRDNPEVLKLYAGRNKLALDRWTLLHGDEDAVRTLAAVLGVKYQRDTDGNFGHSAIITVLDRGGEIVHQQEGLGADPTESVQAIERSQERKD